MIAHGLDTTTSSDSEKGHWMRSLLYKHMKRGCYTSDYSITFATAPLFMT